MNIWVLLGLILLSYLLGSIPWGYIVVKVTAGKDVRKIESGRTGGTNAMRAVNFSVGLLASMLDILKSAVTVWLAKEIAPEQPWVHIIPPIFAILGHNYSIFLIEKDEHGKIRMFGGAGGAPAAGGAIGLWWPSVFILLPLGALIIFGIGYASLATMSFPVIAILIFLYRTLRFGSPWEYLLFGFLAEILILWALRPNIRRLRKGTERLVGWRANREEQGK
jgi:glycerol-3-phosphate acyltransferase PlsY